jgi:hypothetical protein
MLCVGMLLNPKDVLFCVCMGMLYVVVKKQVCPLIWENMKIRFL